MSITKKAPADAKVFDLSSAKSARAEARVGQSPSFVKLSAGYVELKPEIDVFVMEDLLANRVTEALTKLFVDPKDAQAVKDEGLNDEDLKAIFELAAGKSLGELQASSKP